MFRVFLTDYFLMRCETPESRFYKALRRDYHPLNNYSHGCPNPSLIARFLRPRGCRVHRERERLQSSKR